MKNGLGTECVVYINKSHVDVIVCKYSFFNSANISCQSSAWPPQSFQGSSRSSRASQVKIGVQFTHACAKNCSEKE